MKYYEGIVYKLFSLVPSDL